MSIFWSWGFYSRRHAHIPKKLWGSAMWWCIYFMNHFNKITHSYFKLLEESTSTTWIACIAHAPKSVCSICLCLSVCLSHTHIHIPTFIIINQFIWYNRKLQNWLKKLSRATISSSYCIRTLHWVAWWKWSNHTKQRNVRLHKLYRILQTYPLTS